MSAPIDLVLSGLSPYKLRENGKDRWRAICPVCGERNPNTLSVGVRPDGAVLIRCFKSECSVESITAAIGLQVASLFPQDPGSGCGPLKRRRLINLTQALELLEGEMTLAQVCSADLAQGKPLTDDTRQRLLLGAARVALMRDEVRA
jgi:hypothetical protein